MTADLAEMDKSHWSGAKELTTEFSYHLSDQAGRLLRKALNDAELNHYRLMPVELSEGV